MDETTLILPPYSSPLFLLLLPSMEELILCIHASAAIGVVCWMLSGTHLMTTSSLLVLKMQQ